jgi:N-acetylgalactosamine-6-sulfatase
MSGRFNASGFGGVHPAPAGVQGKPAKGQAKREKKSGGDSEDGGRLNVSLAPGVIPVTQLLKQAGYVTAHVGKWHLNTDALDNPAKYGLDFMHSGQRLDLGKFTANMKERNGQDQQLARAAIDFMKKHRDQPFYLQLWFTVPHSPVRPSEEELKVYEKLKPSTNNFSGFTRDHYATRPNFEQQMRAWCAQVTGHDKVVGEVLAALDELGLATNTIVLYTSDNGSAPPAPTPGEYREEINAMSSASPWRGHKNSYYDGGIRVPCIVRWPGKVPAGRVDRESCWASVDWLPTVCHLAGAPVGKYEFDGRNVGDVLFGATRPCDREIVWGRDPRSMAIRDGNWKLHWFDDRIELYDLAKDPVEARNVAAEFPDITDRLKQRLAGWKEKLSATLANGAKSIGAKQSKRQ